MLSTPQPHALIARKAAAAKQQQQPKPSGTMAVRETGAGAMHVPRGPPASVAAPQPQPFSQPLAALQTAPLVSLTEERASAILATAASEAAGVEADDLGSDSDASVDTGPMTQQQRNREMTKISNRILERLGEFEEQAESGEGSDSGDLVRLREGIIGMAGNLKKKGMMRLAFLQSAVANMSRDRADEESDGGDSDDALDPDDMLNAIQKKEGTKKAKLALVHEQMVGTLQEVARGLSERCDMADKLTASKTHQLEVDLAISREETKAVAAERDQAKAAAKKSELELSSSEGRLARQSAALEQAHGEADHMAARISSLETEITNEQRRNRDASAQAARAQQEMGELKARADAVKSKPAAADPDALSKLESANVRIGELDAALASARGDADAAQAEAAEAREMAAAVRKEFEEGQGDALDAWAQVEEAHKEGDELRAELEKAIAALDVARADASAATAEAAAAREAAASAQDSAAAAPPAAGASREPPAASDPSQPPAPQSQLPASQPPGAPPAAQPSMQAPAAAPAAETAAASRAKATASSVALRMARGARSAGSGVREEAQRRRMADQAAADATVELLRIELRLAEEEGAAAVATAEESHEAQRQAAAAVHTLQTSVWKATRSRVPAGMDEAIEAAVGTARAEWETKAQEERQQLEARLQDAVKVARVEAAEQANAAIVAAEAGGGQLGSGGVASSVGGAGVAGSVTGAVDERPLREQLEKLHKLHLEQTKAITADFETRLADARTGAMGDRIMTLVSRAADLANSDGGGPLAALLAAVEEIDVRLSEALGEALRAAQRRQLVELTEAGRVPSNALDQAVRAAWEHLWELSLTSSEGRESMLTRKRADHDEARSRVAAHVSGADDVVEAAAVAERHAAVERAEVTDGLTGYRRTVREMGDARDTLAREQALSASLRAELEAAYVSRVTAERLATQRLEELNTLGGILHKVQSDMRVEVQHSQSKAAGGAPTAADAQARYSAGDVGTSALSLREDLMETLRQARARANEESGAVELQLHERAMLETLREEVERQKAMRLSAAQATDASREVELEALREEMAAAETRQSEVLKELSIAWQRESQRGAAANEAQIEMVQAEAEKRLAAAAAAAAAAETALQIQIEQLSCAGAATLAAETEAVATKHALEIDEVTRRANSEVERVVAAQRYIAEAIWDALVTMQDHTVLVFADATVLSPGGAAAAASADHPAASLAALRALGAHGLAAAQRGAESMARRVWVVCAQAAQQLNLEPPPPLRVDSSTALPALVSAHATLLEQLLTVVRAVTQGSAMGGGISAARGGTRRAMSPQGGDHTMAISPAMDLTTEISRSVRSAAPSPTVLASRANLDARGASAVATASDTRTDEENRLLARMEARQMDATRRLEAKREAHVEQQRRSHELAMESFGTIAYSGSQFGELRSCLDSAPFNKRRPASADVSSRPVAAWPGNRPVSALAAVASTVDVVYTSAADTLMPPPPTLSSFENAPLRPFSGSHLPGGGNVPALAIPVGGTRRDPSTPTPTFNRRQATSSQPQSRVLAQRNRPASAAEMKRPSPGGAVSMLVGKVPPPDAALKRPQSAAALLSGTLTISTKQATAPSRQPRS